MPQIVWIFIKNFVQNKIWSKAIPHKVYSSAWSVLPEPKNPTGFGRFSWTRLDPNPKKLRITKPEPEFQTRGFEKCLISAYKWEKTCYFHKNMLFWENSALKLEVEEFESFFKKSLLFFCLIFLQTRKPENPKGFGLFLETRTRFRPDAS